MALILKSIEGQNVTGKTVILRGNLDLPIANGEVVENSRLKASMPTFEYLIKNGAKIVVIGHMGRPNGAYVDELSLMPVRFELGRLLRTSIKFANIEACANSIKFMENGEITMLENLRFDPREESDDPKQRKAFIETLANLADFYVNDCFGTYRKHASLFELAKALPAFAGFSMINELNNLEELKKSQQNPYTVIIGGKKIDTKLEFLSSLINKADNLLIGGAMAYTFLAASNVEVGDFALDKNEVKKAKEILTLASKSKTEIVLPIDHLAAKKFDKSEQPIEIKIQAIPKGYIGLDIGPKTLSLFREIIEASQSVLWNGPMGVYEWEQFSKGTEAIGEYIALSTPKNAKTYAGGGDTLAAMQVLKIKPKRFSHVSVGGGMMLAFLSGESFEILTPLKQK